MTQVVKLAAAAALALAAASPALAYSVSHVGAEDRAASHLADPDDALSGLYKHFAGAGDAQFHQAASAHGQAVTYDLPKASKSAKPRDGYAEVAAHPTDASINPFMSDLSERAQSPGRTGR